MKHTADFPTASSLPYAPLAMPKQQLERNRSLLQVIRERLFTFATR
jgi:hypothetical protein